MSVNQAGGFARSRPGLTRPNLQLYFNPLAYPSPTPEVRRLLRPHAYSGFVMSFNSCRPTSRGTIDIVSADPLAAPAIRMKSLATEHDLADIAEGAQLLRRIAAVAPLREVIAAELSPGPQVNSPEALLEDFRQRAGTVFHPCSSCAMGPDPQHSVVDAALRVHGLAGLRVVDASVFPTVTSGNTNAPVIMVAEKAADLILKA